MKLQLDLGYRVRPGREREEFPAGRNIAEYIIRAGVAAKYQNGLDRAKQRLWVPVQDALLDAVTDGKNEIEISKDQAQFVFDTLDKWDVPVPLASWYMTTLSAVEDLLKNGQPS